MTLVGRDGELAALLGAVEGPLVPGGWGVVVIEGEAGIGKTSLVDAVLARLPSTRVVYRAAAEAMGRLQPYGVVADAFGLHAGGDATRQSLAAALRELAPAGGDPHALLFRVVELLITLVQEEASGDGLVVVEDVHWADPASLSALHRLTRSLPLCGCRVVCTARPVPRPPELDQLLSALPAPETLYLELGPLPTEATLQLVEGLAGAPPGPGLLAQAAKAGGNPLYLTELVGGLRAEGSIRLGADGRADTEAGARVPSLSVTILQRLRSLPAQTVELLSLGAVLGEAFSVTDLSTISGRTALELAGGLRDGIRSGVLVEVGERLGFRHGLVRDAVYGDIPAAVRTAFHREAARALEAAGAPALQVAEHLLLSARPGDNQAVTWLRQARRGRAEGAWGGMCARAPCAGAGRAGRSRWSGAGVRPGGVAGRRRAGR
ncbi:MAG: ATP-binding protein [Acidimicrobiales bacterium]